MTTGIGLEIGFVGFKKKQKENVLLLTGSLAVVGIDDDDSDKK